MGVVEVIFLVEGTVVFVYFFWYFVLYQFVFGFFKEGGEGVGDAVLSLHSRHHNIILVAFKDVIS